MSMLCPKCGGSAKCLDSRPRADLSTYRRYACRAIRKCGARWSTLETLVSMDKKGKRTRGMRGRSLNVILKERMDAAIQKAAGDKLRGLLGL